RARRSASPGVASCTRPRSARTSRRVVIGANRTPGAGPAGVAPARGPPLISGMNPILDPLRRWWGAASARQLVLVALAAVMVFGLALLGGAWAFACSGSRCPSTAGLAEHDPDQTSKVYAADGRLITELGLERRTVVPLAEMSPAVIAAFLATEDKRFYQHDGVDWIRVLGAVKANILAMGVEEGFSTITMQLAGNLWPEDINRRERSIGRKLREAKVARAIERRYGKDKILELYLNQIDLGNRAFG